MSRHQQSPQNDELDSLAKDDETQNVDTSANVRLLHFRYQMSRQLSLRAARVSDILVRERQYLIVALAVFTHLVQHCRANHASGARPTSVGFARLGPLCALP